MVLFCVVPKCKNCVQTPGISMHRFPSDETMKKAWTLKLQKNGRKNGRNIKSMRICSDHFKPEDYRLVSNGRKVLKNNAVPSIFPPKSYKESDASSGQLRNIRLKLSNAETVSVKVKNSAEDFGDSDESDEIMDLYEVKEMKKETISHSKFEDLPDVALLKIFNYLNFKDRCHAGSVCRRWYNISKSPAVWKKIDVKVNTPYDLLKFILSLPSSVRYLSIFCQALDIHHPLWFPDIMSRLHERCPHVKTLIFENVFFSQRFCNTGLTTDHVLNKLQNPRSCTFQAEVLGYREIVCSDECCNNKFLSEKFIPENRPQELCILSLRYTRSYMCHLSSRLSQFIPRVRVLDLTYSVSLKDAVIPFFNKLIHLEELYLAGCPITNSGIENLVKTLKKLKVLDLEGSRGVNDETFEILQTYGKSLEKLYLGNTNVQNLNRPFDVVDVFPQLQMLCLKNTEIDDWCIRRLMQFFPSLNCVDVSFCNLNAIFLLDGNESFKKKLINNSKGHDLSLCHHFKEKYMR